MHPLATVHAVKDESAKFSFKIRLHVQQLKAQHLRV
jgi:hypothetical protein